MLIVSTMYNNNNNCLFWLFVAEGNGSQTPGKGQIFELLDGKGRYVCQPTKFLQI